MINFLYLPFDDPWCSQYINLANIISVIDKKEEGMLVYFTNGTNWTFKEKQADALREFLIGSRIR